MPSAKQDKEPSAKFGRASSKLFETILCAPPNGNRTLPQINIKNGTRPVNSGRVQPLRLGKASLLTGRVPPRKNSLPEHQFGRKLFAMVTSDPQFINSRRMVAESQTLINQVRAAKGIDMAYLIRSRAAIESSRKLLAEHSAAKAKGGTSIKEVKAFSRDFHVGDFVIVWRQADGSVIV